MKANKTNITNLSENTCTEDHTTIAEQSGTAGKSSTQFNWSWKCRFKLSIKEYDNGTKLSNLWSYPLYLNINLQRVLTCNMLFNISLKIVISLGSTSFILCLNISWMYQIKIASTDDFHIHKISFPLWGQSEVNWHNSSFILYNITNFTGQCHAN